MGTPGSLSMELVPESSSHSEGRNAQLHPLTSGEGQSRAGDGTMKTFDKVWRAARWVGGVARLGTFWKLSPLHPPPRPTHLPSSALLFLSCSLCNKLGNIQ